MPVRRELHEDNRRSWNAATRAHNGHKGDQAAFLRSGGSTLFPEEVRLLGDLSGARLLHLQCNSGQDTLSLARSAREVLGVDISDEAIAFARRLSRDSAIAAEFVRADVYDWLEEASRAGTTFDVVFSSYGALAWLSDLRAWAAGVAGVFAPEGRLVVVDFHPALESLGPDWKPRTTAASDGELVSSDEGVSDYVAEAKAALVPWGYEEGEATFVNPFRCHEFEWTLGSIRGAIEEAGLNVDVLEEYDYLNGAALRPGMRLGSGRRWYPPEGVAAPHLMFGLTAGAPRAGP
jgi:SAM-dependent methyltransferase